MKAVVSEKGQVTLPKPIRDTLGIRTGTVIEFTTSGGKLVGKKVASARDPVDAVTGILARVDVDAALVRLRGRVE
jgi:antitoxin PrlF